MDKGGEELGKSSKDKMSKDKKKERVDHGKKSKKKHE